MVGTQASTKLPARLVANARAHSAARFSASMASRAKLKNRPPSAVTTTCRVLRSNNGTPMARSSRWIAPRQGGGGDAQRRGGLGEA